MYKPPLKVARPSVPDMNAGSTIALTHSFLKFDSKSRILEMNAVDPVDDRGKPGERRFAFVVHREPFIKRLFFIAAALYNFVWMGVVLCCPETVLPKPPPFLPILAVLIGIVGLAFCWAALKPRRWLIGLTICAKGLGPVQFVSAVLLGYLAWSQWWMPVVNDLVWLPPLIAIWLREART